MGPYEVEVGSLNAGLWIIRSYWPPSRDYLHFSEAKFSVGRSGTQMPWGHLPLRMNSVMVARKAPSQTGLLPFKPQSVCLAGAADGTANLRAFAHDLPCLLCWLVFVRLF